MNLLPQKEIKTIKRESAIRIVIVVCFLVALLEVISVLMLVPSYVIVRAQRDTLFESVEQVKRSIVGKGSIDEELKVLGSDIHSFIGSESLEKKPTTEIIKNILSFRPAGITSNSVSVVNDATGGVIQLSGTSATREALIEYQRILNLQDFVKEAHYVEKFIMKKTDINYTLIVSLK